MTDPGLADNVLATLASRRDKRKRQHQEKPDSKSQQVLKESNQSEIKESIFEPVDDLDDPDDFFDSQDIEDEEEETDICSKPKDDLRSFRPRRYIKNEPQNQRNLIQQRIPKRPPVRRSLNPESASTFEEQIEAVGSTLVDKLSAYQAISALNFTHEWIECILDENDSIYSPVYDKLMSLDKEYLLNYIRILVSSLR